MYFLQMFDVESDKLEQAINNGFNDYDSEDSFSCYIGDGWNEENIIRTVKADLGKFDYLINVDYGRPVRKGEIYDKNGNHVKLKDL